MKLTHQISSAYFIESIFFKIFVFFVATPLVLRWSLSSQYRALIFLIIDHWNQAKVNQLERVWPDDKIGEIQEREFSRETTTFSLYRLLKIFSSACTFWYINDWTVHNAVNLTWCFCVTCRSLLQRAVLVDPENIQNRLIGKKTLYCLVQTVFAPP